MPISEGGKHGRKRKKSLWKKTTAEKQYRYSEKIRLTERDRTLRQFFITVKLFVFRIVFSHMRNFDRHFKRKTTFPRPFRLFLGLRNAVSEENRLTRFTETRQTAYHCLCHSVFLHAKNGSLTGTVFNFFILP